MAGSRKAQEAIVQTDVLIVGGGPVGLALATDLGSRGVNTILVEKGDGTIFHPRANTVNSRTMEFCRRWGIADEVCDSGAPADFPPDIVYMTSLQGFEIARIERPTHGGRKPLPHTPERSQRCNQLWFDPILRKRAASFPTVSLRYQTRLDAFEQDNAGISADVTDLTTDQSEKITARYLVSACGGASPVPKALGVRMEGQPVLSYHLNLYLKIPDLWTCHDKGKAAFYMFVGGMGRDATLIELNGRDLWRLGLASNTTRLTPDKLDIPAIITRLLGPDIPYELISALPWTCRSIVADRWQDRLVFLAGDAVHQHGPAGGFGMNTGLGDAVDLGWKLAAMIQGWGGPSLMDSYEAERRPVAQRNVAEATENMLQFVDPERLAGIAEDTPEAAATRRLVGAEIRATKTKQFLSDGIALGYRYTNSPIVAADGTPEPPQSNMLYHATTYPGARAPHAFLPDGRSTLDLFGHGFTLLSFGADPSPIIDAAKTRAVPLTTHSIDDPDIATLYERRLVLVRADGHVAWRSDWTPPDPLAMIDHVRGAAPATTRSARTAADAEIYTVLS